MFGSDLIVYWLDLDYVVRVVWWENDVFKIYWLDGFLY